MNDLTLHGWRRGGETRQRNPRPALGSAVQSLDATVLSVGIAPYNTENFSEKTRRIFSGGSGLQTSALFPSF